MTKYKCGHEVKIIIMDCNPLSMTAWLIWKEEIGFDGDKSQCWDCFCKELKGENK